MVEKMSYGKTTGQTIVDTHIFSLTDVYNEAEFVREIR